MDNNNNNSQTTETCRSSAFRGRDCNRSTSEPRSVSVKDGPTQKRKATPYPETQRKKIRLPGTGLDTLRGVKRPRENGEGLPDEVKEKKRRTDLLEDDKETASTSMDKDLVSVFLNMPGFLSENPRRELATKPKNSDLSTAQRVEFGAKYQEEKKLGQGGCGSVFAGYRKVDNLPASPNPGTQRRQIGLPGTGLDTLRGVKRSRENGEGLPDEVKEKKRRADLLEDDEETASTSTDKDLVSVFLNMPGFLTNRRRELVTKPKNSDLSTAQRVEFEAKYQQEKKLGQGGCGSVFAGYRKVDNLPVAIKHIPKKKVYCKHVDNNGVEIPTEVAIMLKLATATSGSAGSSAPVSLVDWYDLGHKVILVLERPDPTKDLLKYIDDQDDLIEEEEARIILKQLVDAALYLQEQNIFHRDIKLENILIELGGDFPRTRLIDFGLSCFTEKGSSYNCFYGTTAHATPEWFRTHTYSAGPSTVWQLGVVAFEMFHKDINFEAKLFLQKELGISANLSENCQDFLHACLEVDPQQRHTLEQLKLHPWLRASSLFF